MKKKKNVFVVNIANIYRYEEQIRTNGLYLYIYIR